MPLTHRPAGPHDIDDCWRLARCDRFYPPALRETRTAFWRRLIAEEAMLSVVVEDHDYPPESRLRAFAFSVFVSDAFAEEAKTVLPPGLSGHLHAQTLAGKSPILSHAAIGRANARGGLILLPNPFGYASDGTDAAFVDTAETMFRCLFSYHAGYQIKEFLAEDSQTEWAIVNIRSGLRLRTEHPTQFAADPAQPPVLLGLTRDEAFASLGNRFFPLFLHTPPCFGFRRSEQRLLRHALQGGTNEDIAQALCVSLSAVKKGWEAIYARAADVAPELYAPSPGPPEKTRGAGKKDRLLAYLRQHPEELRPYQP